MIRAALAAVACLAPSIAAADDPSFAGSWKTTFGAVTFEKDGDGLKGSFGPGGRFQIAGAEGLRRLWGRGRFVQPPSGREALGQLAELASPVQAFVEECCVLDERQQIDKKRLYGAWKCWCEEHGHQPGTDGTFGRNLAAAFPQLQNCRVSIPPPGLALQGPRAGRGPEG